MELNFTFWKFLEHSAVVSWFLCYIIWFYLGPTNVTVGNFPLRIPSAILSHLKLHKLLPKNKPSTYHHVKRHKRQIMPGVYSCGHQVKKLKKKKSKDWKKIFFFREMICLSILLIPIILDMTLLQGHVTSDCWNIDQRYVR